MTMGICTFMPPAQCIVGGILCHITDEVSVGSCAVRR